MNKQKISRKNLRALAKSHIAGHSFTLQGQDRHSDSDDIRLSHELLEAAIRCYIDGKFGMTDVADRFREAADLVEMHPGGAFELTGWKVAANQKELAFAYLLLEQAIAVRLECVSDPVAVSGWLSDAIEFLKSQDV